jgi:hypothetical protein
MPVIPRIKNAEETFNIVRCDQRITFATGILVLAVVDRLVLGELLADRRIQGAFIGVQAALAGGVLHNELAQVLAGVPPAVSGTPN